MEKKIGLFIRSLHKGGAEKQSVLLAKYLQNFFPSYLIVFYPEGDFLNLAKKDNINLILLSKKGILKTFQFYKFLRKNNIYILFCFLPLNNIIGGFIGRLAGVQRIFGGIRGSKIKESKVKMNLQKFVCNHISEKFISNSMSAKKTYSDFGYNSNKIIEIPNAIEVNYSFIDKIVHKEIRILSVGRFTEEKDYFTAIKAIYFLLRINKKSNYKFSYKIIGYGDLKKSILFFIDKHNLAKYIEIIDGNKIDDITPFLRESDIFLNTSIYEGMSNAVMEAMSFSLPIVATKAGDTSELVIDGFNGFLCKIQDCKDIASKLKILINNFDLRKLMSFNSYKHILDNFSLDKIGKYYLDLINSNS